MVSNCCRDFPHCAQQNHGGLCAAFSNNHYHVLTGSSSGAITLLTSLATAVKIQITDCEYTAACYEIKVVHND